MELSINTLKNQLNIESGYTTEDALLTDYLNVAINAVYNYCDGGLSGYTTVSGTTKYTTDLPNEVIYAIILIAHHFYTVRNIVSFSSVNEVPYAFKFLLSKYKDNVTC